MEPAKLTLLIVLQTILSLLLFAGIMGILVYFLRHPVRQFKYLDLAVFKKLEAFVSTSRNRVMLFVTFLGSHQFLIPFNLLLIGYFLFISRQNWFTIRIVTIALSSLILMLLLKNLFQRRRPLAPLLKAARGLSFPSGHAITAVTFYGLLIYIISQMVSPDWLRVGLTAFLVILILWIGFTRIYIRVHYASDVIAGLIIGLLWLLVSLWMLNQLENYVHP